MGQIKLINNRYNNVIDINSTYEWKSTCLALVEILVYLIGFLSCIYFYGIMVISLKRIGDHIVKEKLQRHFVVINITTVIRWDLIFLKLGLNHALSRH